MVLFNDKLKACKVENKLKVTKSEELMDYVE